MAGFSNEHNSSSQPCCCMSFLGSLTFTYFYFHSRVDIDDIFSMMVSNGTCDNHYTTNI